MVGSLLRAITSAEPDPTRTIRSVSAQLTAPALVGDLGVVVREIRRGSAMSTWSAEATDASGARVAVLTAILGSARPIGPALDVAEWGTLTPPSLPPFDDVPRVSLGPLGPVFMAHIDMRPTVGVPTSGGPAETLGWVRYDPSEPPTSQSLLALVDAWWPACLVPLRDMRPIATVNFTANLLVDPDSIGAQEPLIHHAFVSGGSQGFTSEQRRLWTADGRLVVDNLQSILFIA